MSQAPESADHSEYFAARAAEERRMAMAATNEHVRSVHMEMAARYSELAKGMTTPSLKLVIGGLQRQAAAEEMSG